MYAGLYSFYVNNIHIYFMIPNVKHKYVDIYKSNKYSN